MRKKFLTRANMFLGVLLGALGFSSCNESAQKYGPPESLYGPVPEYGVEMPEAVDSMPSAPVEEDVQ